ncbi:hypothetical protein acsn021_20190 [Anaerocolumna cellulosilytica]|uniref:Uncharacterized protein n=1 Tax=Anaerocolumna cellulosilytica TaxID=433286 RepID=A0A6S6R4V8_9FIRM|nr:methyltransferase domain-containing protein [Anaerocolumna cellulosilytica]MBB5196428.1 2-polyprenyl-3-methyl-5-hydroxy-6-metoxy-1,4-benzoquinol methylase [Anaerocolumna cellulosilytica]BCJ94450.1 hypothetical protein acsn021_20190 [Anaerocolumna cellulosilytica]
MNYMGDSAWWNKRFQNRELNIIHHEKYLEEDIKKFPKEGKILDIACGDGRNSIYLARLGYVVHAIDFSEEALTRLNYFSTIENLDIKATLVDLSINDIFVSFDKYEAIIINHYKLNSQLYKSLMNHINEGGILWVNGFREVPKSNPNITETDILSETDFITLDNYMLESKILYESGSSKFCRYMWRK